MDQYRIAGIAVGVQWTDWRKKNRKYLYHDCVVLPRALEAFRELEACSDRDMTVAVNAVRNYSGDSAAKRLYNQAFKQSGDRMTLTVFDPLRPQRAGYSVSMSKEYSLIDYTPHIEEYEHFDLQWMMHPFEGNVLYKGGIVLHGAAIETCGSGIVFTGVSGAGKSTQARLWRAYRNALILNGDCPAIRLSDGIPKVYGTPWCGTSGECVNRAAKLKAVVLVKQGESNALRELTRNDAFLALLANVLRSNFDDHALDLSIVNISGIIGRIRVYELTCTVGEQAVELLERELFS